MAWKIESVPMDALAPATFAEILVNRGKFQSTVIFVPVRLLSRVPRYSWPLMCYGTALSLESLEPDRYDDAVVNEWSSAELRFRLRRLIRSNSISCGGRTLSWGPFWVSGERTPVRLTTPQYTLLVALLRAGSAGATRGALLAVLEAQPDASSRLLDMHVSRLRRRLGDATKDWPDLPRIVSLRSRGYRLELPSNET